MNEYHKIQTVFLRNPDSNYKNLLLGKWSKPEFDLLKNIDWVWTEKIDGTNIRIMWDGESVKFGGRTDNAQIRASLLEVLQNKFTVDNMSEVFKEQTEVCLYGEGYGKGIHKGGNYLPESVNFILFDIKIEQWWLTRDSIEEIAEMLGVEIVPIIGLGTLDQVVKLAKQGFTSRIAENKQFMAEGLIMKPQQELFNRGGKRVITKIKYKDFC
ncbi:RNA ligase family protein [Dapis sp. BLCC M229]|uniref:RNA ligase family protein n=1 Tax=Dapis sp. BLCC M229 TaxID=3400188 RepID=UPI003CF93B2B